MTDTPMETLTIQDTRRQDGAIGFATVPNGVCEPRDASSAPGTRKKPDTETDTKVSPDRLWHVIVWNDPINLMSYVTFVLQKLFGYSLELATKLMLQVHNDGRSIVATVEREKAEQHVTRLHQYGLQATLEKQEC